jgi:hypothetical protein
MSAKKELQLKGGSMTRWMLVGLLAVVVPCARAATILTTGIGFAGAQARCIIINASSKPVEVDSVAFIDISGNIRDIDAPTTSCTFPTTIQPAQGCSVVMVGGGQTRCAVATKGNSKSIRATLELFFSDGSVEVLEAR